MRKSIISVVVASILLSGCATTGSDRDYVVKVNGVETNNPEHTSSDILKYITIASIVGVAGYLGVKSLEKDDPLTQDQLDARERIRQRRIDCAHLLSDEEAYDECVFG